MCIEKIDSKQFVAKLYNECVSKRNLPFAYWKHKALAMEGTAYSVKGRGCYYSVYGKFLSFCISDDGKCHIPARVLNDMDCIQLLASMYDGIKNNLSGFVPSCYHKLHYDFSYNSLRRETGDYLLEEFDFACGRSFEEASAIISRGKNNWMKAENVRKITREPVFTPDLWLFAKDVGNNRPIGIIISTYDSSVNETDIEWLYILPEYQGKGIGRLLIEETIKRSKENSSDIRAGGVNAFYRKCGFIGKEETVWAAKAGFSLVAPGIQPNLLP